MVRARRFLRVVVAVYDWIARLHFGLFGLGISIGAAFVVTTALSYLTTLPAWSLAGLGLGFFFMSLGVIGWIGDLVRPRQRPMPVALTSTAKEGSGPHPPGTDSPRALPGAPVPVQVQRARLEVHPPSGVITTHRTDDANAAREEIQSLVAEGAGYAERLRALDLDPADNGYQPEDEKLVKDAEDWLTRSREIEDYWFAPGSFLTSMKLGAILGQANAGSTVAVRRPVWRQQFVVQIEQRVSELRERLK